MCFDERWCPVNKNSSKTPSVSDDQKPAPSKALVAGLATAVAALFSTAFILWIVLTGNSSQTNTVFKSEITLSEEASLWLDEPASFEASGTSSTPLADDHTVKIYDESGAIVHSSTALKGSTSWMTTFDIQSMPGSILLLLEVLDKDSNVVSVFESGVLKAKTTELPSQCDLPKLKADYGSLVESGSPSLNSDEVDPSTFSCEGDSVGTWMGETFIGIGPSVRYYDHIYYTPGKNRYQEWFTEVESLRKSGPYTYSESKLEQYPLVYDCYFPNEGDPEAMTATVYVHGIIFNYWNEGCLESNKKYILEAALNVPVKD